MPICRQPAIATPAYPGPNRVRLSRHVLVRRIPPRAANDNRKAGGVGSWLLPVVFGTMPTASFLALLFVLF